MFKTPLRCLSLVLATTVMSAQGAITTYQDPIAFQAAAGPVRVVAFNQPPISAVHPGGGLGWDNYGGVCFSPIFNHFGSFLYVNASNTELRVDLPPNTYAAGLSMGLFNVAQNPYRVTLPSGEAFYPPLGAPDFFGVVSTEPIAWISFSHDQGFPVLFQIQLTAAAGSVASCPVPTDAAGPITSAVALVPNPVAVNTATALTATLDDTLTGGNTVASAQYAIAGAPLVAMSGSFNTSASIVASATVPPFTATGVYDVCVRGTDALGNVGQSECIPLPVYDPSAGFITGGGWIQSPAGAYTGNTALEGKASFGFVSKYLSGASIPSGNTQFIFHAANFTFRSTSYHWLVVSGARAQYKGAGTINGAAGYTFLLTAIDGQVQGGGGTDRFRLKIWNGDGVVYDNQMSSGDDSDPTTTLGGGSIVIHK